jgi:hypothetical protein
MISRKWEPSVAAEGAQALRFVRNENWIPCTLLCQQFLNAIQSARRDLGMPFPSKRIAESEKNRPIDWIMRKDNHPDQFNGLDCGLMNLFSGSKNPLNLAINGRRYI